MMPLSSGKSFMPLIVIALVIGAVVGTVLGYVIWGPAASNYSLIGPSNGQARSFPINGVVVTYPAITLAKVGTTVDITISMQNTLQTSRTLLITFHLEKSTLDDATNTALGYTSTRSIPSLGTDSYTVEITPTQTGYGLFMIYVNGAPTQSSLFIYSLPSNP